MICYPVESAEIRSFRGSNSNRHSHIPVHFCILAGLSPLSVSFHHLTSELAMPFGAAHTIILRIAKWAVGSFFDTIEVINGENVPTNGPVIMYEQLKAGAHS